jgi:hypothetical protein
MVGLDDTKDDPLIHAQGCVDDRELTYANTDIDELNGHELDI